MILLVGSISIDIAGLQDGKIYENQVKDILDQDYPAEKWVYWKIETFHELARPYFLSSNYRYKDYDAKLLKTFSHEWEIILIIWLKKVLFHQLYW